MEFHALTVSSCRTEAEDACVLAFEVPAELRAPFAFAPGQHVTLRAQLAGVEQRRSYSVCAARGEGLRVGVRRVAGGLFSNWLLDHARRGAVIDVAAPEGRFGAALARTAPQARHLLGVAGGSGITPILSIVKTVLNEEPMARVSLFYANRTQASAMFADELAALKNRFMTRFATHLLFSRELLDSPLQGGRLDAVRLASLLRLVGLPDEAFVCGPHGFNDEVEAALRTHGLAPSQVHVERFGLPPERAAVQEVAMALPAGMHRQVTVLRDGLRRRLDMRPDDASVLAAARRAELEMPYSCQSGVCATCRARVLQGQVDMARNFALEPAEVAAGWVLACQVRPLSADVVLSFDAR